MKKLEDARSMWPQFPAALPPVVQEPLPSRIHLPLSSCGCAAVATDFVTATLSFLTMLLGTWDCGILRWHNVRHRLTHDLTLFRQNREDSRCLGLRNIRCIGRY